MNEFLSSNQEFSFSRYTRLLLVACLDILMNLPIQVIIMVIDIAGGSENSLNLPYVSWSYVHSEFSTIVTIPASVWSRDRMSFFTVKWNAWLYVFHATIFFAVFGTTGEMRAMGRRWARVAISPLYYVLPCLSHAPSRRKSIVKTAVLPSIAFTSNPNISVQCV